MNFILLLAAHYLGDFIMQPREMATKKSEDMDVLWDHVCTYGVALVPAVFVSGFESKHPLHMITFMFINMMLHGIIDWNIWRWYKKGAPKRFWEDRWFWSTVGLDQTLHIMILYWTWTKLLCS